MTAIGGCNAETVAEALDWARSVASDWEQRVRLKVEGRGAVGQLMWSLEPSCWCHIIAPCAACEAREADA